MERRIFGTDGIRGKVGDWPINAEFILKLGWAAGRVLIGGGQGKVLIGKDTRISGYMFESVLQAGLSAAGVDSRLLGPVPTPAVAYLTRTIRAQAGIVISASHNPYYDNGIKFFSADGKKLSDEMEVAIEKKIEKPMITVDSSKLGKAVRFFDASSRYIEFCKSTIPLGIDLKGMVIVLDCAQGASYYVAPCVFEELGAKVFPINNSPNGLNINYDCGSTHPAMLQAEVLKHKADVGIAFDGDADRVVMVDHKGELVDGDEILFIIALLRKSHGIDLAAVVGTIMSNSGLETALQNIGLSFLRTQVGDRYVLEKMEKHNLLLGGESSGHIICLDRSVTGDGIISALQVLQQIVETGNSLHELKQAVSKLPQHMINIRVPKGFDIADDRYTVKILNEVNKKLAGSGRVVVRPSGTEPLFRVMVESKDASKSRDFAEYIGSTIKDRIKQLELDTKDTFLVHH